MELWIIISCTVWELLQFHIINNYIVYNILWCVQFWHSYVLYQYNNKDNELIYKVNSMIYDEIQCYFLKWCNMVFYSNDVYVFYLLKVYYWLLLSIEQLVNRPHHCRMISIQTQKAAYHKRQITDQTHVKGLFSCWNRLWEVTIVM